MPRLFEFVSKCQMTMNTNKVNAQSSHNLKEGDWLLQYPALVLLAIMDIRARHPISFSERRRSR